MKMKHRCIVKNLHSDGLSGDQIDDKELKKRLAHNDYHNAKKRKLGTRVAKLINENGKMDIMQKVLDQNTKKL